MKRTYIWFLRVLSLIFKVFSVLCFVAAYRLGVGIVELYNTVETSEIYFVIINNASEVYKSTSWVIPGGYAMFVPIVLFIPITAGVMVLGVSLFFDVLVAVNKHNQQVAELIASFKASRTQAGSDSINP